MAKTSFASVDDYIALQPAAVQRVLRRVRRTIRKAVPEFEGGMSYQIPAYSVQGRSVLYFAGWTQHYSVYPATARLVAAFRKDLAPYEVSKGTIRFPLSEAVPVALIEAIARFRAKEAKPPARAATRKATAAAKKR